MIRSLVMAGGRGSRLGMAEKGLLKVCGRRIIDRILETLTLVSKEVIVVTSRNTKGLREYVRGLGYDVDVIEGTGRDYVFDLKEAMELLGSFPVLVAPSDMPFLSHRVIKALLSFSRSSPEAVINVSVPSNCSSYRRRGPTGLSMFLTFSGPWRDLELCLYPDLIDIDTSEDLEEALLACPGGFTGASAGGTEG